MFDPSKYVAPPVRPLPVILLLDVSGSMLGEKIDTLNKAVDTMIKAFATEASLESEITVSVITFGEKVTQHMPYTQASKVSGWIPLQAGGGTPMGTAMRMAKDMIEDKNMTPSRGLTPQVVLVSDGQPTDKWEIPLNEFINGGRSSKCNRFTMAIGKDADIGVLQRFIAGIPARSVFIAEDAGKIHEFFEQFTMETFEKSRSQGSNQAQKPAAGAPPDDGGGFFS